MHHLFVYGTLRPGGANHRLLNVPTIGAHPATADGLGLYAGPGFPYVTPLPGHTVVGTLCSIPDDQWTARQKSLDLLEAYDAARCQTSHYLRRRWTATPSPDGRPLQAWIYLAGPRVRCLTPKRLIASGDWLNQCGEPVPRITHRATS